MAMSSSTHLKPITWWKRGIATTFAIVICGLLLALLLMRDDVTQHFDRMRRAASSALIWNTAQFEVDTARFGTAFALARSNGAHNGEVVSLPPDVMRRWRALQNRHAVLMAGMVHDELMANPNSASILPGLSHDMVSLADAIDGKGATRQLTGDELFGLITGLQIKAHRLAVLTNTATAATDEKARESLATLIDTISWVRIALGIILGIGVMALFWQQMRMRRLTADLAKAKIQAESASRAKTDFLAHMSHEFRTPLNAIIGFSDVMHKELFGPVANPRYQEYIGDIGDAGAHLLNLVNEVLDLAKIESGKSEVQPVPINIPDLLQNCADLISQPLAVQQLTLQMDLAEPLPPVVADPQHLKQIVLNLLSNAVKFTLAGGRVSIGAVRHSDASGASGLEIWVEDTGIGIAPENISKAMAPFGQVRTNATTAQQGTGLGLPITKSLAELNGGRFEIRSEIGRGTKVSIHFPADKLAATKLAA